MNNGLNLELLGKVLALRHVMRLRGEELTYKLAIGIQRTVKCEDTKIIKTKIK